MVVHPENLVSRRVQKLLQEEIRIMKEGAA
jgi:hypothetical protein